ncbi:MAG: CoA ester lyase [Syntrophaceae bacterium]|nr:CoA ester lyase [Syntrophaceae bacterium]
MILRSFLFVPGNRIDRIEKAIASPADAVIIDLEDAVTSSQKETVRGQVGSFLKTATQRHLFVRVNGVDTPFFEKDIETVTEVSVYGLVIPKTEKPEDLQLVDQKLMALERGKSIPQGQIRLVSMIETALGLSNVKEIGTSTPRVLAIAFGAGDLTLDLGAKLSRTGEELLFARSSLVLSCRLAGVTPIDAPYILGVKDMEGLRAEALRSRQLGFRGKFCIHPSQVETVNEIFSPTPEEIDRAKKIVDAFEQAKEKGIGAIALEGEFVDPPIYNKAKQLLDLAKEIDRTN